MSRVRSSLKNASVSLVAQLIILILQVFTRRLFIEYLSLDYLGCNSLFANIFSCMTIFEANTGAIFSFLMYQAIATDNRDKICKIIKLNKLYNLIMAGIVLVLVIPVYFCLPVIVKNTTDFSWGFLKLVFLLYFVKVELGLLLGYYQLIFDTNQRNYVCTLGNIVRNLAVGIIQIFVIINFHNYIAYLVVELVGFLLYYTFIRLFARQQYSYLKNKCVVDKEFVQETKIVSEFKSGIIHKVAHTIYSGTDSIIITSFLGLTKNALYSNYLLLRTQVVNLFADKIMNAMSASVGNYVYDDSTKDDNVKLFKTLDMLGFFMASFCSFSFCLLCEPFICTFWGDNLLLGRGCLFMESVLIYLTMISSPWSMFRNSFGNYKIDRNLVVLSAVANIVVSLSLVKPLGIVGILIGTAVGDLFQIAGYLKVVFIKLQGIRRKEFLLRQIGKVLLCATETFFLYYVCSMYIANSLFGLLLRGLVCVLVPNLMNVLIFFRTEEFEKLKGYAVRLLGRGKHNV